MGFLGKTVLVGYDEQKDKNVYLRPDTRKTHMHILGSTGEGKSKFIEHMIRQDIINEEGLCLIDPHGHLYNDIVDWCARKQMFGNRKIILFDVSEEKWSFGFNPLHLHSSEISFHVDAMVRAVAKVWGGEDLDRTPLLKRCLRLIFYVLAQNKLSFLESRFLLDQTNPSVREYLTQNIDDPNIKPHWDYANSLNPRQFEEQFSSTINRMIEFLSSPIIRNTIGQTEACLDFRKLMDEGAIFLVNLAAADRISDDNARLLGTLMVNDLFMSCRSRPEGSRPFYLYIDECARFINEDIARILDEARKFGLHLILAHQHLGQLKKAGEDIYHSIVTDAKTKVIFGGLSAEDARVLVEQVFLGELDLEEPKHILDKPTVVGYIRTWLKNYSEGRSTTTTTSRTTTEQSGSVSGSSRTETMVPEEGIIWDGEELASTAYGSNKSKSYSRSEVEGESVSHGYSETSGISETLEAQLKNLPTQVRSLDEQIWDAMNLMVNQPTQYAIIKLPKQQTNFVKTPTIEKAFPLPEDVFEFKENSYKAIEFARQKNQVEKLIKERMDKLENAALEVESILQQGGPGGAKSKNSRRNQDPPSFRE